MGLGPTLLYPRSRGGVSLRSADPSDPPVIDPRYGTEPGDLDALVEGVKRAREIFAARPFDPWRGEEYWPGADVRSDAELGAFARRIVESLCPPVGTCAMGEVVDAALRVRGVERLRVADAFVMPRIVGGNTNAACLRTGEKAADLLRP